MSFHAGRERKWVVHGDQTLFISRCVILKEKKAHHFFINFNFYQTEICLILLV